MTVKPKWTPKIADAYANKYGEVAQDFLSLVVEPSLAALEHKRAEIAAQPDEALAAFHLYDHHELILKTRMALCLGIQSLWEQQIRKYLSNCVGDPKNKAKLLDEIQRASWGDKLNQHFTNVRGLVLQNFQSYERLYKLHLLGNVCRHGEGDSAEKLRMEYPDVWPQSMVESIQNGDSLLASLPLYGMQITAALLRDLVNGVVLFWLDMRIACTEALIPNNPAMVEEVARLQALRPALL